MNKISQTVVFFSLLALVVFCGLGAFAVALMPDFGTEHQQAKLNDLFSTLTHLFAGGVGAVTMMGARS
ncbi:MAG: hypothetical protein AAF557_22285 [Pseudomonadota bacterium]